MFFFTSDISMLSAKRPGSDSAYNWLPGELREINVNEATLFWIASAFTSLERGPHEISVSLRRPQIDLEPIVELRWSLAEDIVVCRRRWSGEFGAFFCGDPRRDHAGVRRFLITSHLKLVPLLLRTTCLTWKKLEPGYELRFRHNRIGHTRTTSWSSKTKKNYDETVREVRSQVLNSVASLPDGAALLLSGGIDSSVVAAAAQHFGKRIRAFTFSLDKLVRPQKNIESDLICAQQVAAHLRIPLSEIALGRKEILQFLPLGIYLAETPRGTIVDDCAALSVVARTIARSGFSHVWMGEAADDLFGGFKFALRYYRGAQLRAYYRAQLTRDLPNELAIIQNVFGWFGISVVHPVWTVDLLRIGYNLPLSHRVDPQRLMKRVLRDAFRADLPAEIVNRPKCVTRDSTQIRYVLEDEFGTNRDRYRSLFHIMMGQRERWPRKIRQLVKNSLT